MSNLTEQLLTKKQLAEILRLHPRTITRLMAAGQVPYIRIGAVAVRFRLSDVMAALTRKEAP